MFVNLFVSDLCLELLKVKKKIKTQILFYNLIQKIYFVAFFLEKKK